MAAAAAPRLYATVISEAWRSYDLYACNPGKYRADARALDIELNDASASDFEKDYRYFEFRAWSLYRAARFDEAYAHLAKVVSQSYDTLMGHVAIRAGNRLAARRHFGNRLGYAAGLGIRPLSEISSRWFGCFDRPWSDLDLAAYFERTFQNMSRWCSTEELVESARAALDPAREVVPVAEIAAPFRRRVRRERSENEACETARAEKTKLNETE